MMRSKLVIKMKNDLKDLKVSGATIDFTPTEPIPGPIIKKILKERLKEFEEGK